MLGAVTQSRCLVINPSSKAPLAVPLMGWEQGDTPLHLLVTPASAPMEEEVAFTSSSQGLRRFNLVIIIIWGLELYNPLLI